MVYMEIDRFSNWIKPEFGAFSSTDAEWDLWLWLNTGWLLFKTVPGYLDGISNIPYKIDLP